MTGFLAFVLMVLSVADTVLTAKILAGGGSELWPPMRKLMDAVGSGWAPLKVALSGAAIVSWMLADAVAPMVVAICVMALIVAHNAREYRKVKLRGW